MANTTETPAIPDPQPVVDLDAPSSGDHPQPQPAQQVRPADLPQIGLADGFATAARDQLDRATTSRSGPLMATPPGGQLFTDGQRAELQDLELWIRRHDEDMVRGTVVKADEYGSGDLEIMASGMMTMNPGMTFKQGVQAAIAFYAQGKVARIMSALQQGRMPSHDSWRDLEVYAKIGLKFMETDRWV